MEGKCCAAHAQQLFRIRHYWTELLRKLERKLNNGVQRQKVYHKATFVISAFKVLNYLFGCQRREQLMSWRWQRVTSAGPETTSKTTENFQNQQSTKVILQQCGNLLLVLEIKEDFSGLQSWVSPTVQILSMFLGNANGMIEWH